MVTSNKTVREHANVIEVQGDYAWVSCETRSACSACQAKNQCGAGTLSKAFGHRQIQLKVDLTEPVKVGDQIQLAMPQQALLSSAAWVYLLPVLMLMIGAGCAEWLLKAYDSQLAHELWVMLAGGVSAFCGVLIARWRCRQKEAGQVYQPKMVGVVSND